MSAEKERVKLTFMGTQVESDYVGRLVGWVTDKQMAQIHKNKELRKKLMTAETMPFEELYEGLCKFKGERLVVALTNKDGGYVYKTLLITDKIHGYTYITEKSAGITFKTEAEWADISITTKRSTAF